MERFVVCLEILVFCVENDLWSLSCFGFFEYSVEGFCLKFMGCFLMYI